MNYKYLMVFGWDYEGEDAKSIRFLESICDVDDHILSAKLSHNYDYYKLCEIKPQGIVKVLEEVEITKAKEVAK